MEHRNNKKNKGTNLTLTFRKRIKIKGCLHEIRFHLGQKIFFSVSGQFLIIIYMIQPKMKLIASVISLLLFWQKWNFISVYKISCKALPEMKSYEMNLRVRLFHQNKNDWLLLNGLFFSDHPFIPTNVYFLLSTGGPWKQGIITWINFTWNCL